MFKKKAVNQPFFINRDYKTNHMKNSLQCYQDRINQKLVETLNYHFTNYDKTLFEAVKYATLNDGKRIRPALIYGFGDALQVPLSKLDSAAMAMELIHSYSLVHDDLPSMDDDDLRRGQPTCHIKYSEATAILVGDAQQNLAYEIISNDKQIDSTTKVKLIQILSQASGLQGMIGGQYTDIQSEGVFPTETALKNMHQMKTGALIKSAVLLGACQSQKFDLIKPELTQYAESIGLAFQVHDDILDIESDTKTLGKPAFSDEELNKATYPKLMGIKKAKSYRDQLIDDALQALNRIKINSEFLIKLTSYISLRRK